MATQQPPVGSTLQGDPARQSAFTLWALVRGFTVYPLIYLIADGIGGLVARSTPVDAYDVRILIITAVVLWFNSARFFHYRLRFRAITVTPLIHWFSVATDLQVIVVDASPFLALEVCRWIYFNPRNLWSIALQLSLYIGPLALFVRRLNSDEQTAIFHFFVKMETWAVKHRDSVLTKVVLLLRSMVLWGSERKREANITDRAKIFTHQPLKSTNSQIRLLRLHRTSIFGDLKSEIKHFDLDAAPPYEAISYSWGTSERSHSILINNMPCRVTLNAEYALRSAQSILRRKWVWIDSVCINQTDAGEKDAQIMLMKEIYRHAVRVIVSLGDAENIPLVWQLLTHLNVVVQSKGPAEIYAKFQNESTSPAWLGLDKLIQNPWFDRIWIIQEIAVASDIQIHYGSLEMSWADLQSGFFTGTGVIGAAEICIMLAPLGKYGRDYSSARLHSARNLESVRQREQAGIKLSLYALLELFISSKASEARDHVIALQGLSAEGFSKNKPDSGKSADQVYTEAGTGILVTNDRSRLSLLSLAGIGYGRTMESLPSWVPEWGSGLGAIQLTNTGNRRDNVAYDYAAATSVDPIIQLGPQRNIISVGGLRVDTVRSISKSLPLSFDSASVYRGTNLESNAEGHRWRGEAWQLAQTGTPPVSPSRESRREAFWRTLMGNRIIGPQWFRRPAPAEYGQYLEDGEKVHVYDNLFSDASKSGLVSLEALICERFGSVDRYRQSLNNARLFYAACGPYSYNRHFCCTEKGSMGLVPPGSKVGDLVCILFGAQTPFILRPAEAHGDDHGETQEPSYILIGECYMHGMMDGETITPEAVRQMFKII